jgi:hypothetical protein
MQSNPVEVEPATTIGILDSTGYSTVASLDPIETGGVD